MKKIVITSIFFLVCNVLFAQSLQSYVQFSAGYSPAIIKTDKGGYNFSGEYGKTHKWLDIGLSVDHLNTIYPFEGNYGMDITYHKPNVNHFPDGHYQVAFEESFRGLVSTAIRLNSRINLIKLFIPDSRHALKIGVSWGYDFNETIWSHIEDDATIRWSYYAGRDWNGLLKTAYEYDITPKIALGANYFYDGNSNWGLSIRRNF